MSTACVGVSRYNADSGIACCCFWGGGKCIPFLGSRGLRGTYRIGSCGDKDIKSPRIRESA